MTAFDGEQMVSADENNLPTPEDLFTEYPWLRPSEDRLAGTMRRAYVFHCYNDANSQWFQLPPPHDITEKEAKVKAREAGWKNVKGTYYCPDCVQNNRTEKGWFQVPPYGEWHHDVHKPFVKPLSEVADDGVTVADWAAMNEDDAYSTSEGQ